MANELAALTDLILKFRNERNWAAAHTPKDMIISLVLEVAELAEHMQWKSDEQLAVMKQKPSEAFADEMADVFYWALLIAHDFNVDLESALKSKLVKNSIKYPLP
jgi:dCTP diphosphatase